MFKAGAVDLDLISNEGQKKQDAKDTRDDWYSRGTRGHAPWGFDKWQYRFPWIIVIAQRRLFELTPAQLVGCRHLLRVN